LVDIYYLALDASKSGDQLEVDRADRVTLFPHFMERKGNNERKGKDSYHSISIWGILYDAADKAIKQHSEKVQAIQISMLPCFAEMKATPACTDLWRARYEEYLTKSRQIINLEKEEKSVKFLILYQNYKNLLYGAEEFEESPKDRGEVFAEACVIYRIVYERAASTGIGKCGFAWTVAGAALCELYAHRYGGITVRCPLPVLRKLYR